MAAIDVYLQQILDAIYGEEVRGSIHDSIAAMNVESSTAQSAAISARDSAKVSASVAEAAAEAAAKSAEEAELYAEGGLHWSGSIIFDELPTTGMKHGDMYNMKEDFTTDDRFVEGAGVQVKAGTNVAWSSVVSKWDVLATGGADPNDVLHKDGSIPAELLTIGSRFEGSTEGVPSLTLGSDNVASNRGSTAIGGRSEASGTYSFAYGYGARATGNRAIAIGAGSIASGTDAIAHGYMMRINGDRTITGINGGTTWIPDDTLASAMRGSEVHRQLIIFNNVFYVVDKFEDNTIYLREPLLDETQEEGVEVTLTVRATGANSAAGVASHAEGAYCRANGNYSHAEGQATQTFAQSAHAEGSNTKANGLYSHAEGYYTTASYSYQHVSGKYNVNRSDTLFEVGNGTATSATSNAFEVTSDGYIRTKGNTVKIAFGVDENGNYGYYKDGADTVTPFKTGGGGDVNLQEKTASPTTSEQIILPDADYDGLSKVTLSAIQTETTSITPSTNSQTIIPTSGKYFSQVTVGAVNLQSKSSQITPSAAWSAAWTSATTISPDSGYTGLSQVSVQVPMLRDYTLFTVDQTDTPGTVYNGDTAQTNSTKMLRIKPSKTGMCYTNSYLELGPSSYMGDATASDVRNGKTFSSSAGIQITGTASIGGSYQTKTVTPSTSTQYVTPDSSYDALSQVTVNPIPNQRSASSETITAAKTYYAGYYSSSWTVTPGGGLSFGSNFYPLGANGIDEGDDGQMHNGAGRSNFGTVGKKYLVFATNRNTDDGGWDVETESSGGNVNITGSGWTRVSGYNTNKNAVVIQITSSSHSVYCISAETSSDYKGVYGGIVELA